MVIDHSLNPKASTGCFTCVFRQPTTISHYVAKGLEVRGHRLPLNYFYRGNINMVKSIDEHTDDNTILTIKDSYGIMMSPDEDSDTETVIEEETCNHATKSTEELIEDASFLSSQLEEILRKVSSIIAKKSSPFLFSQESSSPLLPETRSMTEIKLMNHIYRTASFNS